MEIDCDGMAKLKLVSSGTGIKAPELRMSGTAPAEDMKPGKYLATCETAWIEPLARVPESSCSFALRTDRMTALRLDNG